MASLSHRINHGVGAGIAVAVVGLGILTATGQAQDSAAVSASHQDSDAEVSARVRQALQSSEVNSRHINVSVRHGDVVLSGFVQDNRDLLSAAQVATKAASGYKIVNNLSIKQNYPNAP